MNILAINFTKTVIPLYQTTTRYVPEEYNIKIHVNSVLVTPLIIVIIVSRTFCWLQGALWYFFLPVLLCETFVVFSLLMADLHNVCGYCKCLFKSNHLCSLFRQHYFYFVSFSTFLSPYFPLVLSSLPSWCNFFCSSTELFLPRQWCSSLFPFDRNVLSQTEQYGTKL